MGKGKYRFRAISLSEMMPNSWFYKLRNMRNIASRRSRKVQNFMEKGLFPIMETGKSFQNQNLSTERSEKQDHISNRPTYYIPSRNRVDKLPDFPPRATETHAPLQKPRKNKTKSHKNSHIIHSKLISSSFSSLNSCQEQSSSVLRTDQLVSTDYILPTLPPIVTKPIKKEGHISSYGYNRRPSTPQTPRIKMRLNSPKLAKKKVREKNQLADSFVVVKFSSDPQSDFRESMLEMIFQNNLWASKDLEELLSWYLYLNSDEYHDLIVKAFKQIWFDLTVMNLKYK